MLFRSARLVFLGLAVVTLSPDAQAQTESAEAPSPSAKAPALSAEALARYAGTFEVLAMVDGAPTIGVRLFVEEGALVADADGMAPTRLIYRGEGVFEAETQGNARLAFGEDGADADLFVASTPNGPMTGVRVEAPAE